MKKFFFYFMIISFLSGCGKEEALKIVTSVSFEKNEKSIKVGETEILNVIHTPSDLPAPFYAWESSNNDVATVTNGKVTGISVGETTIKVTVSELGLTTLCKIKVNPVEAGKITLNSINQQLTIGDEFQLTATIEPVNTTDKSIIWKSNDEKIVTVTNKGLVKAIGVGKAIINATSGNISVACNIVVEPIYVMGISLSHEDIEIEITDEFEIQATISPENATNKNVIWSSSNQNIAKVSKNGLITGIEKGKIIVTATTEDGNFTAECNVTVTEVKVKSVSLNYSDLKLAIGENRTLSAIINPANAANKSVTWTSSNSSVASIDQNGNLLTLDNGNTVITVKTNDGSFQASCNVTVSPINKLVTVGARLKFLYQNSSRVEITLHSRLTNPTNIPIQISSVLLITPYGITIQTQPGGSVLVNNRSEYNSFNLFFDVPYINEQFFRTLGMYKVIYQFVSEGKSYQMEQNFDTLSWGDV